MKRQRLGVIPEQHTHLLIWCAAILCAILSVAVIIMGIAVFIGYVLVHPRIPFIGVVGASLDVFQVDPAGVLVSQVTIEIKAENDNAKAHASFQDLDLVLSFGGLDMAELRADPFDVRKNSSTVFHYVVQSPPISLDPEQADVVSDSLTRNEVTFNLKGSARTRWRLGLLGSVKFWCHLDCHLQFHPLNQTLTNTKRCSSRGK